MRKLRRSRKRFGRSKLKPVECSDLPRIVGHGHAKCRQIARASPGPIYLCRGSAETWSCGPRHFECFEPPTSRQPCARRWRSRSRRFTPQR
jgi:hypothetical protein